MNPTHDSNRRKVHARQTQDYLTAARERDAQVKAKLDQIASTFKRDLDRAIILMQEEFERCEVPGLADGRTPVDLASYYRGKE